MKKVVLCLIGLYLAIAVLCFVFDRQPAGEVAMIHIKANRAVLLGSTDECLEIILYLTDTDSFFTETSNIESVSIQDENQMVMASVAKIMPNSQTLNIASLLYFPFSYQLVFDQVITSGGQLIFFQPHCQIVYQNGVMLDIEMGDLTLSFMDVSPIEHLDFTRL